MHCIALILIKFIKITH